MRFPLSISTYGELILFGKWTRIKLAGTIWETLIIKILDIKFEIKKFYEKTISKRYTSDDWTKGYNQCLKDCEDKLNVSN